MPHCGRTENPMEQTYWLKPDDKTKIPVYTCYLCCVGSGCAAWNGAHSALMGGMKPVFVVTEGVYMGTSRNTGSDKQTYYKQSTNAMRSDSAMEMAEDYFACGAMHGDLALTEAAGSLAGFFKLISLGVPFPHDIYGEFTGYRTDHDEKCRATSLGPLTSRYMTEALEKAARQAGAVVFDGYRAVQILTHNGSAAGIVCISDTEVSPENPAGLAVFASSAVLWAVGGPSALYHKSVYPESQSCALGTAMLAGADGVNLTEFQYGLASLKFRWNVSGSYQQVIPRYISTAADGSDPREFLYDIFSETTTLSAAVFRKGYEWPFSPEKLNAGARSSLVDIAVYREIQAGRRVWMDFTTNGKGVGVHCSVTAEEIGPEAFAYLQNCGSVDGTPIDRLRAMNEKAYQLYLSHGIDLETEMLEVGVCAQHMNGGLEGDIWYESPALRRLFPCGEANGVFGIRRPGGSALNSTQVSSMRAAEKICHVYTDEPACVTIQQLTFAMRLASILQENGMTAAEIRECRENWGRKMDACAAFLRNVPEIKKLLEETKAEIDGFFGKYSAKDVRALTEAHIHYDTMLTRYAVLTAMYDYACSGGHSRGSYVITDGFGNPAETVLDTELAGKIQRVSVKIDENGIGSSVEWMNVRPIPREERWFEEVYRAWGTETFYK